MSWPQIQLSDIGDVITGATPPSKMKEYFEGNVPFVTPGDLETDKQVKRSLSKEGALKSRVVKKGATFVCCIGATIGKISQAQEFSAFNQQINAVQWGEKINPKYGYYALSSIRHIIINKGKGAGTTLPILKKSEFQKLKIPFPPLEEQKRIAEILDKADAVRRKLQQAIDLADQLLRSIFLDMFGDPVANPKDWKVELLNNLSTKISSGSTPVGGSKVYVKEGTPFLRSQNVWRRRLELDDVVYIDEVTHRKMNKTSLKNKDILITKTGRINTENSSLGRAAMFLGEDDSANINGHVYLIRPKPEAINEFILYIITTKEYRDYIRSVCVGGIDKRQINKVHLEQFPIIAPPVEAQQQFIKYMRAIEKQKEVLHRQLELANNMFSSLTQQAFNCELTKQTEAA